MKRTFSSLTKAEKARVEAVKKLATDVVERNVHDYIYFNSKDNKVVRYTFSIETEEQVGKVFKKKTRVPLGYCSFSPRKIVLNLDHVLLSGVAEIVDTILHECAHAVAAELFDEYGHGKYWKRVCRVFDCRSKAKAPTTDEYAAKMIKETKYQVVALIPETEEVLYVCSCSRRLKEIQYRWVKGRKDTKGLLWHIDTPLYEKYKDSYHDLKRVAFR